MSGIGGQVRLITGESFGAGKSYFAVMEAEKIVEKGSPYAKIYSNIRAHAELGNGITEMPDDWRTCDQYSLLIIDELQKSEKFSKHFSSRRDSEIVDFTEIRHKHLDVWLITPNTKLINADIRELVSHHYYIEVASKKVSKCFVFKRAQTNITKGLKQTALDTFTFNIEEKYWKLYKSTEDGVASDRQTHFNMNLLVFAIGALFTLGIIAALFWYLFADTKNKVDQITTDENGKKVAPNVSPVASNPVDDLAIRIKDCQEQFKWSAEMCRDAIDKKAYEQRTGELAARTGNDMNTIVANYNPNRPYDVKLPEDIPMQINDYPRMSGVITVRGGKLMAVNQYGDYMPDVSQEDCRRYLNGYRPFDYSGAKKSIGMSSQASNNSPQINDLQI
ncbi:zonular occludens toxin domain-containing protein [Acinetobacter courvalinii]|uniref:zonular occludens toxin domain-containing protein n=1 Tax=Acinetobacter courvalinii TaxID=280147 RepID=UPI0021CDDCC0|nr:zonular occludens toxin domain-containing protein [Acinetobacter courvalinii]MCU4389289.1 zonular occludens toxin domain-containing protein [Acinetobacter courvalinii]